MSGTTQDHKIPKSHIDSGVLHLNYCVLCQTNPHFASQNNTLKEMVIELEGERTQHYS